MFATLGLLAGISLGVTPRPMDHVRLYRDLRGIDAAHVSVWLDRSAPYNRGDRARVYVSSDRDAYLTVLRIDTDGRVRVLFPQDPWDDNLVSGGRTFEVEDRDGDRAFRVDDAPGEGYVFAIASDDRFDYTSILTQRDHWDYRTIADGQVRGDPYVAVTTLAEQIVPTGEYDYDLAQYDVERHYDYPRFVCYDCHAYVPYYTWNPYGHSCVRFRVVIYDDPYYYPYRYYGGRRVVVVRPRRPEPRYVFVDNNGGRDYVTRIPTRPRREDGAVSGGGDELRPRRAVDVGGRGSIPAPGDTRRRTTRGQDTRTTDPGQARPERRKIEPQRQPDPQQPNEQRPERRERPRDGGDTPGLKPQPQPPSDQPQRREPQQRNEPQKEPERRPEPQRPPERQPEPRAEPQRPPERQPEPRAEPQRPPERRTEPSREPSRGGGRSGSPELRRRRG